MKTRLHAVLAIALLLALVITSVAWANPVEISGTIEQMVSKLDKNGNPYVRFIVGITGKTDSGVEYPQSVPFMAFGALEPAAKAYKEGDTLNVVAEPRVFNGRTSYTILKYQQ